MSPTYELCEYPIPKVCSPTEARCCNRDGALTNLNPLNVSSCDMEACIEFIEGLHRSLLGSLK